jgi:hypothetical protein
VVCLGYYCLFCICLCLCLLQSTFLDLCRKKKHRADRYLGTRVGLWPGLVVNVFHVGSTVTCWDLFREPELVRGQNSCQRDWLKSHIARTYLGNPSLLVVAVSSQHLRYLQTLCYLSTFLTEYHVSQVSKSNMLAESARENKPNTAS